MLKTVFLLPLAILTGGLFATPCVYAATAVQNAIEAFYNSVKPLETTTQQPANTPNNLVPVFQAVQSSTADEAVKQSIDAKIESNRVHILEIVKDPKNAGDQAGIDLQFLSAAQARLESYKTLGAASSIGLYRTLQALYIAQSAATGASLKKSGTSSQVGENASLSQGDAAIDLNPAYLLEFLNAGRVAQNSFGGSSGNLPPAPETTVHGAEPAVGANVTDMAY